MVVVKQLYSSNRAMLRHVALKTYRRSHIQALSSYQVSSSRNTRERSLLAHRPLALNIQQERKFVAAVARGVLRLRWFLATGAIGGSLAARNWYEDWKAKLPDFSMPEWAKFDDSGAFQELTTKLAAMKAGFGDAKESWLQKMEERRRNNSKEQGQQEDNQHSGPSGKEGVGLAALLSALGSQEEQQEHAVSGHVFDQVVVPTNSLNNASHFSLADEVASLSITYNCKDDDGDSEINDAEHKQDEEDEEVVPDDENADESSDDDQPSDDPETSSATSSSSSSSGLSRISEGDEDEHSNCGKAQCTICTSARPW